MDAPSPEQVALVRRGYAEKWPVSRIMEEASLPNHRLVYRCLDGFYDDGSGEKLKPVPRRRVVVRARNRGPRLALALRLWRAAERQVHEIEKRLTLTQQEPTERERDARVLSVLVKTLRELAAFDEKNGEHQADMNEADDDFPRDVDELRRELARKIEGLRAAHAARAGGSEAV